ncbi:unnamed protein product [marine sediment metagenome]|uniref:Uncharacterized protein n=1 Tax=marine sediment metagenome TaxID=412755 RepID=X0RUN4_9ZZZZ
MKDDNSPLPSETLILKTEAFSVNKTVCTNRQGRMVSTAAFRRWKDFVATLISTPVNEGRINRIKSAFDPAIHRLIYKQITYFPSNVLFTLKGELSSRAFDVSNIEKGIIDLIYEGKGGLDINDKFNTDLISLKRCSETDFAYITVEISIALLNDIKPDFDSN